MKIAVTYEMEMYFSILERQSSSRYTRLKTERLYPAR